jgi:hypothetical protein
MAYFAQVENGLVQQVLVLNDAVLEDSDGISSEQVGADFLQDLFGGEWIQTAEDDSRGKFAGIGDTWDGSTFSTPQTEETP